MKVRDLVKEKMFNKWWFMDLHEAVFLYPYEWEREEGSSMKCFVVYRTWKSLQQGTIGLENDEEIWIWGENSYNLCEYEKVTTEIEEVSGNWLSLLEKELAKKLLSGEAQVG